MKYLLLITIILLALFYAVDAHAGIIIRPVFHAGLVGYWDFQEGAGNKAYDKSGHSNHLTLYNNPTWVDGKLGKALDFEKDNSQYLSITDADQTGLDFDGDYTVNFWVNFESEDNSGFFDKGIYTDPNGWVASWWYQSGPDVTLNVRHVTGGTETEESSFGSNDTTPGTWYMMTITYNDSTDDMVFCLNSVCDPPDTMTKDISGNSVDLDIGCYNDDNYLDAKLDEIRIYNRALSDGEIQRLYKLSQPKILAPTKTGLVGYWSFEEGTGTKVGDMSGNGNTGTWSGTGSHWTTGKFGNGGSFNGGSDYVDCGSATILDFSTEDFSVGVWFKIIQLANGKYIIDKGTGSLIDGYGLVIGESVDDNKLRFVTDGDGSSDGKWYLAGNNALLENVWYHVVALRNNGVKYLYINGVQQSATQPDSRELSDISRSLKIGQGDADPERFFNGLIDEVRIYNRALETSEITALYKSGLSKINASQNNQLTSGLVGLWSFNGPDIDGNTAIDRSGQGNNGTLYGPIRTIGKLGQALSFDGSDDYVATNLQMTNNQSFTYSAWFNARTLSSGNHEICGDENVQASPDVKGASIRYSDEGYIYGFIANSAGSSEDPVYYNLEGSLNTWHHVALTYDYATSMAKLYVDGIFHNTGTDSKTVTGYRGTSGSGCYWGIGEHCYNGYYFDGTIDEVRAYNRALSAQEIQRLYNLGR